MEQCPAVEFGEHLLKAAVGGVETLQRHLHGIEREVVREHLQVDARIFMAVNLTNRTLPCFFASAKAAGPTNG